MIPKVNTKNLKRNPKVGAVIFSFSCEKRVAIVISRKTQTYVNLPLYLKKLGMAGANEI